MMVPDIGVVAYAGWAKDDLEHYRDVLREFLRRQGNTFSVENWLHIRVASRSPHIFEPPVRQGGYVDDEYLNRLVETWEDS